jgi:uncharacterized membrane protein (DUF485 family)
MSYDPYPSYQAPQQPPPPQPPPPRHVPQAHGFPSPGGQFAPAAGRPAPAGGRFAPQGAWSAEHDEQFAAHGERFEPFAAQPRGRRYHGELAPLRSAYRRQRRAAGLTLLGFFTLYVLLTVFLPSLAGARIGEGLSLGLLLVLLQLPLTVGALIVYERAARRRVDPLVDLARAPQGEDR